MNMKVLTIDGPGKISYRQLEIPELSKNDVLVKVAYAGICGTDISFYTGDTSFVREGLVEYPVRIGHEWSGVVEKKGDNVTLFKNGDRVISDSGVVCGICEGCIRGDWDKCSNIKSLGTINAFDGAFAEYIVFPERHLHKLADNVTLKQAALIEPASTALAGLKKISITPEKTIAIIGTGPIGLAAIPFAKAFGASKVIMIGRRDDKLQIAKKLGADVCININREDLYTSFDKATNNIGADLVLETSGAQETINHCIKIAARKGTIALIGFYETDSLPLNIDPLVFKELSLTGVMGEFGLIEETANMISNKNIDLSPLITNVFTFDEASNAIMEAKSFNERVKSLVHINQDLI